MILKFYRNKKETRLFVFIFSWEIFQLNDIDSCVCSRFAVKLVEEKGKGNVKDFNAKYQSITSKMSNTFQTIAFAFGR